MSLRFQLNLIISVICLAALITGGSLSVINARQSVIEEVSSTLNLAKKLLSDERSKKLSNLGNIRHLKIVAVSSNTSLANQTMQTLEGVPTVFVTFVKPDLEQLSLRLVSSINEQSFVLLADPSDEIREAWDEVLIFILVLVLMTLFIAGCIFVVIGHSLRPVEGILSAIIEIQKGHLDRRLPDFKLPEFNKISKGINHLSEKLAASKEDNRRLSKKSLNMREDERHYLARELHDEMGQSLSAIKALSVAAKHHQVDVEPLIKIESICDQLFAVVRNRMRQLSPPLLAEFGLTVAVKSLVDEWHGAADVSLVLDDNLDQLAGANSIHLYRITQEMLTNVLKHAHADKVWIEVAYKEHSDGAIVLLSIKDNGVGFDPLSVKWGGGLLGMTERVESLGGALTIDAAVGKGSCLSARLPVGGLSE